MTKRIILGAIAILLVIASAYAAFFIAPEERTMGLIQRIFYFHVASAWSGFTAFFLCFLGNLLYVWKRDQKYDWLAVSGAEVGLAFKDAHRMLRFLQVTQEADGHWPQNMWLDGTPYWVGVVVAGAAVLVMAECYPIWT